MTHLATTSAPEAPGKTLGRGGGALMDATEQAVTTASPSEAYLQSRAAQGLGPDLDPEALVALAAILRTARRSAS